MLVYEKKTSTTFLTEKFYSVSLCTLYQFQKQAMINAMATSLSVLFVLFRVFLETDRQTDR